VAKLKSRQRPFQVGQVGRSTLAVAFVLDADRTAGRRWQRRMRAAPGLDAGLLVDAPNEVVRPQRLAYPATGVEIEDRPG